MGFFGLRIWYTEGLTGYAGVVDDAFVLCLFQTVEELFGDPNDPFCYHVIRVLVRYSNWSADAHAFLTSDCSWY